MHLFLVYLVIGALQMFFDDDDDDMYSSSTSNFALCYNGSLGRGSVSMTHYLLWSCRVRHTDWT